MLRPCLGFLLRVASVADPRVTLHAIGRYLERVDNCSPDEAIEALLSPAVKLAAKIGAPYVRLATGQRIAIDTDGTIMTVLPSDCKRKSLRRRGQ
jgi:hypothetical protein